MSPPLEVKGLKQAIANLNDLNGKVKLEVGRLALRAALLRVLEAVKAATYTTFHRETGAIKAGFGVRVGRELRGEVLASVVVEYPQTMIGNTPMTQAFRRHRARRRSRSRKAVNLFQIAYWWLYLEFGTAERRTARKPKTLIRRAGATRLNRAIGKWEAAASTGYVAARPWVRPTFANTAQAAVDIFTATMREKIEEQTDAMPK